MRALRYLFGPVASRRYGRSLGVDLAPPKTCSLNCRFCQLGPTATTTVTRRAMPPLEDILSELRHWIETHPPVDFITAGGSGEPTLHLAFGDLLRFARRETACQTLLLSNGTLFTLPEVRRDAAQAHVVKLSLHAWDQASFAAIVRPHPSLDFNAIIEGYRRFRDVFSNRLDLEVFIVPGCNDQPEQVARIARLAQRFAPDSITLNTAIRPPAEPDVTAAPPDHLRALARLFTPEAEISGAAPTQPAAEWTDDALVALVSRHPVSLPTLCATEGVDCDELTHRIARLEREQRLARFKQGGETFVGPAGNR